MNVDPHITVFVPGYNVEPWIRRCLESIYTQDYPYFDVLMVDDASTDKTWLCMWEYVGCEKKFYLHRNITNHKMPFNLQLAKWGNPDHVIVIVDADDYLPHSGVLNAIANEYRDPDLWLMYGSYTRYPDPTHMPNPALPFPPDVIVERSFRQYSADALVYNHPLTFRRRLLNEISAWEMQDDEGRWFETSYDHVIMMPMLEMAAPDHFKWNPDVLYVYNEENEQSEAKQETLRNSGVHVHTIVNARAKRDQL